VDFWYTLITFSGARALGVLAIKRKRRYRMNSSNPPRHKTSIKASQFTESVIREMSRLAAQHQAVNLAQGFPDFPCPPELKAAACEAINDNINQYAITWGDKRFREALAEKSSRYLGMSINPETDITVTCGATEAMAAAMLACVDPGDEVIVFEPY
jgi:aminotransferase